MTIHPALVAGSFYPGRAEALDRMVSELLNGAPPLDVPSPKAVILPHAGYRYSGAVAAAGAAAIGRGVRRVVVLGPSHRFAFCGVALPDAAAMATPLGAIPIDSGAVRDLLRQPDVCVEPRAHAAEHSIEVELPFLQHRLDAFSIVPLVVGEIATDRLAAVLETLWGGDETLIVVSTDLTHFLTAEDAERVDLATAQAIEMTEGAALTGSEACGHRPLSALLDCAARRGMRLTRLALTHSGAVSGDMARVVGYGAWMAHDPQAARLSPTHRAAALRLAGEALLHRARHGKSSDVPLSGFPVPLQSVGASFVTLTRDDRLRGCVGSLKGTRPLAEDIAANAFGAGFEDPRFQPVTEAELAGAEIEVAILSRPVEMAFRDEADLLAQLRPGRDGVILSDAGRRATFLPKVWEALPAPADFLAALKAKVGLPPEHWPGQIEVWRYVAESFKGPVSVG